MSDVPYRIWYAGWRYKYYMHLGGPWLIYRWKNCDPHKGSSHLGPYLCRRRHIQRIRGCLEGYQILVLLLQFIHKDHHWSVQHKEVFSLWRKALWDKGWRRGSESNTWEEATHEPYHFVSKQSGVTNKAREFYGMFADQCSAPASSVHVSNRCYASIECTWPVLRTINALAL